MLEFETLFASTADFMCQLDDAAQVVRVNAALQRFLGGPDEHIGTELGELFDEQDHDQLLHALQRLDGGAATATFEGRILRAGPAASAWTCWQLTRLDGGSTVGVGRDISGHRETAQALAAKSTYLHSIIDAEPECVKLVSRTGELLDMNRAGLKMIGASSRREAIGQCVYDLMAPEDRDCFIRFNERVCHGERGKLSFDIIGLDGTRRSMETTAVPIADASGEEMLQLAITRDVTHRQLLERQLRQAQKMEAIGQLAGGVAHDFNNLLTAIIGPAEMALLQVGKNHPIAEDLRQITATSERAARLTQQLLAFARRQVVKLESTSLGELVVAMEEMLVRVLGEPFHLEIDVDPHAHAVQADRGQMEQVILNLVVNARDAIVDSGRIGIRVSNETIDDVRARRLGCHAAVYVALSVTDDGIGISEAALSHVFDPFFTTKPTGAGTGLGLATCFGIVTQLNGAIDVESVEDRGTTFTVLIPPASAAAQAPTVDEAPRVGHAETILVVEDDPAVRRSVARMLTSLGYVVHEAEGGQDALEQAAGLERLALLLTDITMPDMDGPTLAGRMCEARPGVKVIYMTGYLFNTAAGQDEPVTEPVLQKPFTSGTLSDAVAHALDGAREDESKVGIGSLMA